MKFNRFVSIGIAGLISGVNAYSINCDFSDGRPIPKNYFKGIKIIRENCNLSGHDLKGTGIEDVKAFLGKVDLSGCHFPDNFFDHKGSFLDNIIITNTDLSDPKVGFSRAVPYFGRYNLTGSKLPADFKFTGVTVTSMLDTKNGINLTEVDVSSPEMDFNSVLDLMGVTLDKTKFPADFSFKEKLIVGVKVRNMDLSKPNMEFNSQNNLRYVDITGSQLPDDFSFKGKRIEGMNLSARDLSNPKLEFNSINGLFGVNLSSSKLPVNFSFAGKELYWPESREITDLSNLDLSNVELEKAIYYQASPEIINIENSTLSKKMLDFPLQVVLRPKGYYIPFKGKFIFEGVKMEFADLIELIKFKKQFNEAINHLPESLTDCKKKNTSLTSLANVIGMCKLKGKSTCRYFLPGFLQSKACISESRLGNLIPDLHLKINQFNDLKNNLNVGRTNKQLRAISEHPMLWKSYLDVFLSPSHTDLQQLPFHDYSISNKNPKVIELFRCMVVNAGLVENPYFMDKNISDFEQTQ